MASTQAAIHTSSADIRDQPTPAPTPTPPVSHPAVTVSATSEQNKSEQKHTQHYDDEAKPITTTTVAAVSVKEDLPSSLPTSAISPAEKTPMPKSKSVAALSDTERDDEDDVDSDLETDNKSHCFPAMSPVTPAPISSSASDDGNTGKESSNRTPFTRRRGGGHVLFAGAPVFEPASPITPSSTKSATSPTAMDSPSSSSSPTYNAELSAKQVRELRRLCRKTANRAEYEGRLVQLRQIASILAMGGPSLIHFAPAYLRDDSAMQRWLDNARSTGADWRDERPLDASAVEELREWDRLLKAWARRKFAHPLPGNVAPAPPPLTPRTPRRADVNVAAPSGKPPVCTMTSPTASTAATAETPTSIDRRRFSKMSISRVGDVINVNIVRSPRSAEGPPADGERAWRRGTEDKGKENVNVIDENVRNKENIPPQTAQATTTTTTTTEMKCENEKRRDWSALRGRKGTATLTSSATTLKPRNW